MYKQGVLYSENIKIYSRYAYKEKGTKEKKLSASEKLMPEIIYAPVKRLLRFRNLGWIVSTELFIRFCISQDDAYGAF